MKIRVVIKYDKVTKSCAAGCPELPRCTPAGDSQSEALNNIHEAIALYLEPAPVSLTPDAKVVEVDFAA